MIVEDLHPYWKTALAKSGNARVFGDDAPSRRHMDDDSAVQLFTKVWSTSLEPQLRQAPPIPQIAAYESLEGKQKEFAPPGYQYRQFEVHGAYFIARLNLQASETGLCDQL